MPVFLFFSEETYVSLPDQLKMIAHMIVSLSHYRVTTESSAGCLTQAHICYAMPVVMWLYK
jgi:hypothetical protein